MKEKYPHLMLIVNAICEKSAVQEKHIEKYLKSSDTAFFEFADKFFGLYLKYLEKEGYSLNYAVDSYIKLCTDTLSEEIQFIKTGKYTMQSSEQALSEVYNNDDVMRAYMYGLAFSQFLWKNHYSIFNFYNDYLQKTESIRRYLEIGPGHGLFLWSAIKKFSHSIFTAIDLSSTSLELSQGFINFVFSNTQNIAFINTNIYDWDCEDKFDFITMGEVLEHVEDPCRLLKRLSDLLIADGNVFISTCINCPAVDHIYLFKNVDAIREIIRESGLRIKKELLLPLQSITETINYAAILNKNDSFYS
jgi:2-polyprenyl-3-methyl-5-hydroxy-6-metoxy-1,4-benzoquinol methylase|tara:strand:- start:87 stop:998 length:912 start_codon:yes stop_codon:yes gene_type:complete